MDKPPQLGQYTFGPVPSRRLGLSLGVDIIPFKTCPLDCVYCQLGRTTVKTLERREYSPVDEIISELQQRLASGIKADFITFSGSGEPTLHTRLGELVHRVKKLTDIPVAILTNGVLFWLSDVRQQCVEAEVVLPSLDAGDDATFARVNRPCAGINIENVISGLAAFRNEFEGQIWLEVFLVEGFNTSPEQLTNIRKAIERIKPDKIQLNTAVRPTADISIEKLDYEKLQNIARMIGDNCQIIAEFEHTSGTGFSQPIPGDILALLRRRPCSLSDICSALCLHRNEVLKYLNDLEKKGLIQALKRDETIFYKLS